MSREKYEEGCPGCRPKLIDPDSGEVLADDHPAMQMVLRLWEECSGEERQAFHAVCCLNSKNAVDVMAVEGFFRRVEEAGRGVRIG